MRSKIDNHQTIAEELKKQYPLLSDFERLTLAVQIERNQILENGLNVSFNDSRPSSLEAIAIALGYTGGQLQTTITDVLKSN